MYSVGKRISLIILLVSLAWGAWAEELDSTQAVHHFSGNISVTHNGISLLPSFSLGKPAAIFEFSMGTQKFAFEPQLRFSLEGKPWSFIFWFRRRFDFGKFKLSLGAHPSIVFRTANVLTSSGGTKEAQEVQEYLVGEITPTYQVSKKVTLGLYYLNANAWVNAPVKMTQFMTVNAVLSNLSLGGNFRLRAHPQAYFLKMDDLKGYYVSSTIILSHTKSPFFISSILNQKLNSTIAGKDFVWNVALGYSFATDWRRK